MVHASEVYQWFKGLAAHSRIEFACSLLHLCIPNELRFISTLLEDMNNKDYPSLRETEEICNNPNEFIQYSHKELNSESVHKLCLSLSLLKPTNQNLAQRIYEILRIHFNHLCQCVMLNNNLRCEIMLLYALASNHPAFAFQCRQNLAEYFTTLLGLYNDDSDMSVNCNNSALKEQYDNRCHSTCTVYDVSIDKNDAIIILNIVTEHRKLKLKTQRSCHYSLFMKVIGTILSTDHELFRKMVAHSSNGSFTTKNIHDIVSKIILLAFSESQSGDATEIRSFFLNLPLYQCLKESSPSFQKNKPVDNNISPLSDRSPCVFQNIQMDLNVSDSFSSESSSQICEQNVCYQDTVGHHQPPVVSVPKCALNDLIEPVQSKIKNIETFDGEFQSTIEQSSDRKHINEDLEKDSCDTAYAEHFLVPLHFLGPPYQQYCFVPNYQFFSQSKSCSSSSYMLPSNNSSELSNIPVVINGSNTSNKHTQQYMSDSMITAHCPTRTFFPLNTQQTNFAPLNIVPIQISEQPYQTMFSNTSSTLILSNFANRVQPTSVTSTPTYSRQKPSQPLQNSSP